MANAKGEAPAQGPSHPLRPYASSSREHGDWLDQVGSSPRPTAPSEMAHTLRSTPSRTPRSRYDFPASSSLGDLDAPPAPEPSALLRAYLNSGLFSFTSTALVMPFEVGKTLLQVQWVPKEDVDERWSEVRRREEAEGAEEQAEAELSDEEGAEAYFTEVTSRSRNSHVPSATASYRRPRPSDASGYLVRRSIFDESTKPEYTLPVIVQGGTMDMIKAIFRWRGEGAWSLWKGQLTTFIVDTLSSTIQPIILTALSFVFSPSSPNYLSLPLEHHARPGLPLAISVGSFLLTGMLLSPLDLIRTRLIVQSSQPRYKKYSGPFEGLRKIAAEEGGWSTTYLHPNLFFPALLDNLVRPLIQIATPLFIDRQLRIERVAQPVLYGLADLVLSTAGLLLILPIETIRKRLQLQSRSAVAPSSGQGAGKVRPFRPCVETRPAPYAGIVDATYRIITEESGKMPHPSRRRRQHEPVNMESSEIREVRGSTSGSGLLQLYRGFNVGLTANVVVFVLSLIGRPEDSVTGGWAEM